jgi:hypothetical protein
MALWYVMKSLVHILLMRLYQSRYEKKAKFERKNAAALAKEQRRVAREEVRVGPLI